MSLYRFAVTVHARPTIARARKSFPLRGLNLQALDLTPQDFGGFDRTFEEVGAALEALPRMYFEPDGSFVWVSADPTAPWQLDGLLYDRDGRVLHMDLKGTCLPDAFDRILATLGRPTSGMIFQLTREALFLDDETFRSYAVAESE